MFRIITGPQLAVDLVIAGVAVVLRLLIGIDTAALALTVVLMGSAFALRRLSPPLALAVAWAGAVLQLYAGASPDASNLAILAVLYATARYGEPIVRWLGLASAVLGSMIVPLYLLIFQRPGYIPAGSPIVIENVSGQLAQVFGLTLASLATLGLSWTSGLLVRTWRVSRDNRIARSAAEHAVVVEQERNRIARDMHDVVAHSLAVVIAQADGARYARASDPAAVDRALTTISTVSREALADVRLLLAQLRHAQHEGPPPAVADLGALVAQMRTSGLEIGLVETGERPALHAGHEIAIYRIVQEALTNALRHGDPSRPVAVDIAWSRGLATITVTSAMRAGGAVERIDGHGVTGMHERALLVGGELRAGAAGETWTVEARIPVAPIAAASVA
jgi:signal transduction histidine kinase